MMSRDGGSITIAWSASTDNVGVVGYDLSRDGTKTGSTGETTYTFGGLTCNRSYTLGVMARDGSGNVSAQTLVLMATASCVVGDSQPPSAPGSLAATTVDGTSISLNWTAYQSARRLASASSSCRRAMAMLWRSIVYSRSTRCCSMLASGSVGCTADCRRC